MRRMALLVVLACVAPAHSQGPEFSGGEWTLRDCRLTIRIESAGIAFDFASVRVSGSRLYLREEGAKAEAVYKRIKP